MKTRGIDPVETFGVLYGLCLKHKMKTNNK